MIDIHSHIIWGVDDGPESLAESLQMIAAAREAGTEEMVATPHASPDYRYHPELVRERLDQLRASGSGPVLHLGCDFHLSFDNIADALAFPKRYTIAGGPYLLVEFSDLMIFNTSEQDLERLRDAGMTPVITHPERNPLLRQRLPLLERWVEQGCLLQVTASSYLGRFGKKAQRFAAELTWAGLVHVVASDTHDLAHRPPDLRPALDFVTSNYGPATADTLFRANPLAIVRGRPVAATAVEAPSAVARLRRVLGF